MKSSRAISLIIGILSVLQLISLVSALSHEDLENTNGILLKSREFVPEEGLHIDKIAKTHILIQLENFPTQEEKKNLEKKGIKLLDYIPNKAWIASISRISLQEAINLPNVRFIGDILPEDKISSYIKKNGIGQWARDDKGNIYLNVKFQKDVSLDDAKKVIKKLNSKFRKLYKY